MFKRENKIQTVYRIRTLNREEIRILNEEDAKMAVKEEGVAVEPIILTPPVLCIIIELKKESKDNGYNLAKMVLEKLEKDISFFHVYRDTPTLDGETPGDQLFLCAAFTRYASILYSASNIINAYYDMVNTYDAIPYDFERDAIFTEGMEVMYDVMQCFENQLKHCATLYYDAQNYLERVVEKIWGEEGYDNKLGQIMDIAVHSSYNQNACPLEKRHICNCNPADEVQLDQGREK